jgi:signal transduction histidine kinase
VTADRRGGAGARRYAGDLSDALVSSRTADVLAALVEATDGADGERFLPALARALKEAADAATDPAEAAALVALQERVTAETDRRRTEVQARTRVVEAADETRRRLGRDIHDGAQQRLVALVQRLDLARRAIDGANPEQAQELISQAREQAKEAGQELRELAHGLHPAGLTGRGLDAALRLLSARSPLPLEVAELPGRRLPDAVELTVYYLVSEALSNAAKHAHATRLTVRVEQFGWTLRVQLTDDGAGGATTDGSGLRGLADRVRALGGTLDVDSPPGEGTRLTADIPLAPYRDARDPFLEFGHQDDGGLGERLIAQILDGEKTAVVSLAREWDLEGGAPRIGQPLRVQDHLGRTRGTVEVVRVAVLPFHAIDEDVVRGASAGEVSVAEWRATQRRFYAGCREEIAALLGEPEWTLSDDEPMVITWFRLLA